ncbi:MAG: hypothetical protein EBR60_01995 [Burkholderiaceae bacterium]|jgi:hypothetical protein|nr:hypothetical protein [Burkholderiaceae bacterium]
MKNEVAGWTNESFMEDNRGKMAVFFHAVQVRNNFKSDAEKRPIFEERIFIKKLVPGDSTLVVDRPMREQDMEDYPIEWARYEQKKEQKVAGTPIDAWMAISETQKAEFKALNIFTIDQFANLPDVAGDKIMGFNDLRSKARAFIMVAQDSQMMDKIRAEMDKKMEAQEAELAELRAMINKKAGRPKKETVEE